MIQNGKRPQLSIILAATGSGDSLVTALESILCQTSADFELVVVHGPAGGGAEVLADHTDHRIVCVRHPERCSTAQAYNTGISAARGDFVGFISGGETYDERKLEEQAACFSFLAPEYGVVSCDSWEITPAGNRAYRHSPEMEDGELLNAYGTDFHAAGLGTSLILVRRSVLEKAGPFDERLGCFFALDMIIRLQRLCRFHHIKKPLCSRRYLAGSLDTPFEESIARLQLLQKYPEALHCPLFVAQQAEMIRRSLWQAREGTPPVPVHDTNETEHGYHRYPVLDL